MTGISEILVLVLLIVCILILPRLFKAAPDKKKTASKKAVFLSSKIRFTIVISLIFPLVAALYLKPWKENFTLFIACGILPVILVWAVIWIRAGYKK